MRSLCPVPRRTAGEDIAMHLTTNALVLREVNYKESDKILTLLTDQEGKLTASARGCRKKGSRHRRPLPAAGVLGDDPARVPGALGGEGGGWPSGGFDGVRSDLDKLALACYFAEVTEAAG